MFARQDGTGENQGVGGELTRGQALDVQVGLELAAKLLGGAMVGVQGDDRLRIAPQQTRPPAFDLEQPYWWGHQAQLQRDPCRHCGRTSAAPANQSANSIPDTSTPGSRALAVERPS